MSSGSPPKARTRTEAVTPSSGNVFADLELPQPALALAKADLAHRLCGVIRARCLTQFEAGKVLRLTPPKVSDLMRGNLVGFSLDRLIVLLNRLDLDVEIAVRPVADNRKAAGTSVVLS